MTDLLLRPQVSEKAIGLAERGQYVFEVPITSNKAQISAAVEATFKVKVAEVNVMTRKGKLKRFGRKFGQQNDTKKAIVKLQSGQSIKLFEGAK